MERTAQEMNVMFLIGRLSILRYQMSQYQRLNDNLKVKNTYLQIQKINQEIDINVKEIIEIQKESIF